MWVRSTVGNAQPAHGVVHAQHVGHVSVVVPKDGRLHLRTSSCSEIFYVIQLRQ